MTKRIIDAFISVIDDLVLGAIKLLIRADNFVHNTEDYKKKKRQIDDHYLRSINYCRRVRKEMDRLKMTPLMRFVDELNDPDNTEYSIRDNQ